MWVSDKPVRRSLSEAAACPSSHYVSLLPNSFWDFEAPTLPLMSCRLTSPAVLHLHISIWPLDQHYRRGTGGGVSHLTWLPCKPFGDSCTAPVETHQERNPWWTAESSGGRAHAEHRMRLGWWEVKAPSSHGPLWFPVGPPPGFLGKWKDKREEAHTTLYACIWTNNSLEIWWETDEGINRQHTWLYLV